MATLFSLPTSVLLFSFGFCSFCSEVEGSVCSVCSVGLFRTRCHGTAVVGTEVAMAEGVVATHSKCSSPTGIMGKLLLRVQEILKQKCKTHHDYVYSFLIYYSVCLLPSFGYNVLCRIFINFHAWHILEILPGTLFNKRKKINGTWSKMLR